MPIIHVCGAPGSGKTTLARALARDLALPMASVDEERRKLLRPGQSWPSDDSKTWSALRIAVDSAPALVLETMGGTRNSDALLEGRNALNILVSAPDHMRLERIHARAHRRDDPMIGRPDKYVAALARIPHPVVNADAEWTGTEPIPGEKYDQLLSTLRESLGTSKRSPLAMTTDMTVKFAEGSDTIIEGLGVPFGIDLDGQQFTADTERHHDWFPKGGRPILVDHGFDPTIKFSKVGEELSTETREEGDWVRGQLDKASKYYSRVKKLVDAGKVGWSSAAPDHKVKIAADGTIERWPVIEYSLTVTPAKPNSVAFAMKSEQVSALSEVSEWGESLAAQIVEGIEQAHEGDSEPETLADHSERVLAGVKAWVERVTEKSEFRAKSGRELSKRNIEALRETHRIIGELLARADAPSEDEQRMERAKTQKAEYLRLQAESLTG